MTEKADVDGLRPWERLRRWYAGEKDKDVPFDKVELLPYPAGGPPSDASADQWLDWGALLGAHCGACMTHSDSDQYKPRRSWYNLILAAYNEKWETND